MNNGGNLIFFHDGSLPTSLKFEFKPFVCVTDFVEIVTPGPGHYLLPSDFGYLEGPKASPRNYISTQGSMRPRAVSRLQLSTMTGNASHNLGEFSIDQTGRETNKSNIVKSQSVKKRNNMNASTLVEKKTKNDLNDLAPEDSID